MSNRRSLGSLGGRAVGLALVLALAHVTSAHAQGEQADQVARGLFEEGVQAFSEARYETALDRFHIAYRLSQRPGLLYNVGLTEDRLRHDREALEAFEQFLRDTGPDETRRGEVERRVLILRQTIAERAAIEAERVASAEAARQAQDDARMAGMQRDLQIAQAANARPADEHVPLRRKWWLWTVVGVVVVASVAVPLALTSGSPAPTYYQSDTGSVIFALGR